jgi:hypothetical protein
MTDNQLNALMAQIITETNETTAQALIAQVHAELARRGQLIN